MAVTVKKAILWRRVVDNHPGMLANTLQLLFEAGVDLQVVMPSATRAVRTLHYRYVRS